MSYQMPTGTRRERRQVVGRFRGGKLNPVMSVPIEPNEGGILSQSVFMELDPVAGRMVTPPSVQLISVFVPMQALDAIKDPTGLYSGLTDVVRQKMVSGNPVHPLEAETEISKRCEVVPISIGGQKRVSEVTRLAHNCAVNHLRLRKYHLAPRVLHTNATVTPALIGDTVLDLMNGVLDPEDRINGAVQLSLPTMMLPVVRADGTAPMQGNLTHNSWNTVAGAQPASGDLAFNQNGTAGAVYLARNTFARLNGTTAGNVSLDDFFNAQKADRLAREMSTILKENPEYGAEAILYWAHGLSVENGITPWVISEQTQLLGVNLVGAMDTNGVQQEIMRSDMATTMRFTVPIPRTELGGQIVTFAVLKPDETLSGQPHPILSAPWGGRNFVSAEMALDPVPVRVRDMDTNATSVNENNVLFYTGFNELRRNYSHYGLSLNLNPTTVENKTAFWQFKIPLSVTPESILYPADISHFPFANQAAEVVTYTITSTAIIRTPTIFGPSPVETLPTAAAADIFDGVL